MNLEYLLNDIECRKMVMIQSRQVPKAISMNGRTKERIIMGTSFKNGEIYGLEIFIDDKLSDDEFRILRK